LAGDAVRRGAWADAGKRLAPLVAVIAIALIGTGCGSHHASPRAGFDASLPKVDWREPSGSHPTKVMILIHGGGWRPNPAGYEAMRRTAAVYRNRGFATVVIGYSAGAEGFRQIQSLYSRVRRRYPRLPICAYGISAGGNFALMLAAREPDLDCVVDLVGPTDLNSLQAQGSAEGNRLAVDAFGEDQLARYSPVRYANRIKAKVLMIYSETDPVVPVAQGREMARALPGSELVVVTPGFDHWLHGAMVAPESVARAMRLMQAFLGEPTTGR
jgi:dipeptidyl aminopeptidase/acylaminoacyl peptidase